MSTLIVTSRPLTTVTSGYDLRVVNLCAQLGGEQHLLVVPLLTDDGGVAHDRSIDAQRQFASVVTLPGPAGTMMTQRLFRRSDADALRLTYPTYFAQVVACLQERLHATGASRVILFGSNLAGLIESCGARDVVIDVCDSRSLTLERERWARTPRPLRAQLSFRLALTRLRNAEAHLLRTARLVTAINEADSDAVRRLDRSQAAKVVTIPNGVRVSVPPPAGPVAAARAIVFWGNLDFGPNLEAMRFFLHEVYLPHLRPQGIEFRIIGDGATAELRELSRQHDPIRLLGYVPNLADALDGCAVMVNPMVTGSGMKNKVLEAFAHRLAVVTTPLGIEAIPEARHGQHVAIESAPAPFAAAVRRLLDTPDVRMAMTDAAYRLATTEYSWEAVGARWRRALDPSRDHAHALDTAGAIG